MKSQEPINVVQIGSNPMHKTIVNVINKANKQSSSYTVYSLML